MPSAAELAILLRLNDQLSNPLKKTEQNVNSFGETLGKVGKIAAGFLAAEGISTSIRGVVDTVSGWIDKANELSRVEAQLNAVLLSTNGVAGVSAERANELADSYQLLTRYSKEQILSAEDLLLTFTRIGKDVFPQATETVLNMATALGEDTKSAAIQLGKALQDPILGVTALRRVGVAFTASQQEQIKTLVESGHGLQAQKIILAELTTEFGGSATALTNWEKLLRRGQVAIHETQVTLGEIVEGGLTKLAAWLDEHSEDIETFVNKFSGAFDGLRTDVETRIGGVIGVIQSFIDAFRKGVDFVDSVIHGDWQSAWADLKTIAVDIGKAMVNELAAQFGTIPNLLIDALNSGIDALNGFKIPELKIAGHNVIPGGGGGLNVPNIPNIPTKPFDIGKLAEDVVKLGDSADHTSPPVLSLNKDFQDGADQSKKYADALKKFQEEMGKAVESFLKLDAIKSAVSALFGQPTREQADLQVAIDEADARQAQLDAFHKKFGQSAVHFGAGEGPGTEANVAKHLSDLQAQQKTLEAQHKLEQDRITAGNALLLSEQQQKVAADDLGQLMLDQSSLIRDKLNPGITDLVPEINTAKTTFQTMSQAIQDGGTAVSTSLLGLAKQISDFQLPTLKQPATPAFQDVQP